MHLSTAVHLMQGPACLLQVSMPSRINRSSSMQGICAVCFWQKVVTGSANQKSLDARWCR